MFAVRFRVLLLSSAWGGAVACAGPAFHAMEDSPGVANSGGRAGAGPSSMAGAGGEGGVQLERCDLDRELEDGCVLPESDAIHVAPTGSDHGAGTAAEPVKTLARALELSAMGGVGVVLACTGIYAEHVLVTEGVRLLGGFGCPDGAEPWVYRVGERAQVRPEARGYALEVRDVADAVEIVDFEFVVQAGKDTGESSVAAFVVESREVTLRSVRLEAGAGEDGADAVLEPYEFLEGVRQGDSAGALSGGVARVCQCPDGTTTTGGRGGSVGKPLGDSGLPVRGAGSAGDPDRDCDDRGAGQTGAPGPPGPNAMGGTVSGRITTESGWVPNGGPAAPPGKSGQGGGGGAAKAGGGGGGGSCGGCGGKGGPGGGGAGSSIALLTLNAPTALTDCLLVTDAAGAGGSGADGQEGQATHGLTGRGYADGCDGGAGALGGKGGAGGGAAGGLSVGIVYGGDAPTTDSETTFTLGLPGARGLGGVPSQNDGRAGVTKAMWSPD